ncbi:MAG: UDP-N-acetylmuramate dehydrogenase [Gammaproteobacteria bacterium]|nr:UDP-N-acetylmuramate dehydrogenase [Gammaproteobacteria bacterium]
MPLNIVSDGSLQPHNAMAVPARAMQLAEVSDLTSLHEAIGYAKDHNYPLLTLGAGSNILLTDDYPGLVILNRLRGIEVIEQSSSSVTVQVASGENWHDFVVYALSQRWYGLENLALIPGLVGAAPIQNIGAYGVEVEDTLLSVDYLDIDSGQKITLHREQCQFGYRDSIFKHQLAGKTVITSVTFKLAKTANPNISYPALAAAVSSDANPSAEQVFAAVCAVRNKKIPLPAEIPNAGSFFKNPIVNATKFLALQTRHPGLVSFAVGENYKLAAGWLIEQAGWKGKAIDGVSVHQAQALVITNPQGASGAAILRFARAIQSDIKARYNVFLEIEPQLI